MVHNTIKCSFKKVIFLLIILTFIFLPDACAQKSLALLQLSGGNEAKCISGTFNCFFGVFITMSLILLHL